MSPHLSVPCPNCGNGLSIRLEYLGRKVSCNHCSEVFVLPLLNDIPPVESHDSVSPQQVVRITNQTDDLELIRFLCPKCSKRHKMPRDHFGRSVRCSRCANVFVPRLGRTEAPTTKSSDDLETSAKISPQPQPAISYQEDGEKVDSLQAEIARLRAELESVDEVKRESAAEIDRLKRLAEESTAAVKRERADAECHWESRWKSAAEEAERYKADADGVRRQLNALQADSADERSRFERDHASLKSGLASVGTEFDSFRAAHSELTLEHETLQATHRRLASDHLTEVDRLKTAHAQELETLHVSYVAKKDEFSGLLDAARAECESKRIGRDNSEKDEADRLSAVQGELVAERKSRVEDRSEAAEASKQARERSDRVISELEGRLKNALDRIDRLTEASREALAAASSNVPAKEESVFSRMEIEADLAEKTAELEEVKTALLQAQDFKVQIKTFLAGMGIRLPT